MENLKELITTNRIDISNEFIEGRKIIYLDNNFWNNLTKKDTEIRQQLYHEAKQLVHQKKSIFPISEINFHEINKKEDIESKKKTLKIVNELSQGISFISDKERNRLELLDFFLKNKNIQRHHIHKLIWTKSAFIFGMNFLNEIPIEGRELFYSYMKKLTVYDLLFTFNEYPLKTFRFKDNVELLNKNKFKFANENSNYDDLRMTEIVGYLSTFKVEIKDALTDLFIVEKGYEPSKEEFNFSDDIFNKYHGYFASVLKDTNSRELPIFRIPAELHAIVRWNKTRKYKDGNDMIDFFHASYALPYCDFFFTEKELKTNICNKHLDTVFNCKVENNETVALDCLKSIKNGTTI